MRYFAIFLTMCLLPFAAAEETAGTTPDSALYGLDRAMESISLAFTFGSAAKAEKRLAHAEERLMEVMQMIEENKLDAAEKAGKLHDDKISKAEEDLADIDNGNTKDKTKEAMQKVAKVQEKAESHYQKVTEVKDAILTRMQERKQHEQYAKMEQVFNRIKTKAQEMEQQTESKKIQTKEKLKQQGADDTETETAEDEADNESGLAKGRSERAEKEIKNAETALAKAKEKGKGEAEIEAAVTDAEQAIEEAKKAKETGEPKKAREVAEELKEFGNEVSAVANQLNEAKQNGTFEQVKTQLMATIQQRHREHLQAALAEAPAEAQQRIQERIQNWEEQVAARALEKTPGNINSFEECAAAGNPIMESYPRQCQANGKTWEERISNQKHQCTEEEKAAEACTLEYMPVCGDNNKTYGNGCGACASKEVESYTQGECEERGEGGVHGKEIKADETGNGPSAGSIDESSVPDSAPKGKGQLDLQVSDAPADIGDFTSLEVNFRKARIFMPNSTFSEVNLSETVDLTKVITDAQSIASLELVEGTYNKVELHILNVTGVLANSSVAPQISVPSDKLQITKSFTIGAGQMTEFVFDINVVRKGKTFSYNLMPNIAKSGAKGQDDGPEEDEPEETEMETEDSSDDAVAMNQTGNQKQGGDN